MGYFGRYKKRIWLFLFSAAQSEAKSLSFSSELCNLFIAVLRFVGTKFFCQYVKVKLFFASPSHKKVRNFRQVFDSCNGSKGFFSLNNATRRQLKRFPVKIRLKINAIFCQKGSSDLHDKLNLIHIAFQRGDPFVKIFVNLLKHMMIWMGNLLYRKAWHRMRIKGTFFLFQTNKRQKTFKVSDQFYLS
jgi:hypothetical protein